MTEPAAEGLPHPAHPHREPGEGDAVDPKPFIRNGLLFLPDGVYCATAVRLASIESIGIEYDEDDDACTAVTMASGSVHHTDLDWFGSVLEIWETAAWEEDADIEQMPRKWDGGAP